MLILAAQMEMFFLIPGGAYRAALSVQHYLMLPTLLVLNFYWHSTQYIKATQDTQESSKLKYGHAKQKKDSNVENGYMQLIINGQNLLIICNFGKCQGV